MGPTRTAVQKAGGVQRCVAGALRAPSSSRPFPYRNLRYHSLCGLAATGAAGSKELRVVVNRQAGDNLVDNRVTSGGNPGRGESDAAPPASGRLESAVGRHDSQETAATRRANGRGEKIRTSDPLHPMQVRYQAALRPDRAFDYTVRSSGGSSNARICCSSSRSVAGEGGKETTTLVALDAERAAARGSTSSESSRWRAPLIVKPCS